MTIAYVYILFTVIVIHIAPSFFTTLDLILMKLLLFSEVSSEILKCSLA